MNDNDQIASIPLPPPPQQQHRTETSPILEADEEAPSSLHEDINWHSKCGEGLLAHLVCFQTTSQFFGITTTTDGSEEIATSNNNNNNNNNKHINDPLIILSTKSSTNDPSLADSAPSLSFSNTTAGDSRPVMEEISSNIGNDPSIVPRKSSYDPSLADSAPTLAECSTHHLLPRLDMDAAKAKEKRAQAHNNNMQATHRNSSSRSSSSLRHGRRNQQDTSINYLNVQVPDALMVEDLVTAVDAVVVTEVSDVPPLNANDIAKEVVRQLREDAVAVVPPIPPDDDDDDDERSLPSTITTNMDSRHHHHDNPEILKRRKLTPWIISGGVIVTIIIVAVALVLIILFVIQRRPL